MLALVYLLFYLPLEAGFYGSIFEFFLALDNMHPGGFMAIKKGGFKDHPFKTSLSAN